MPGPGTAHRTGKPMVGSLPSASRPAGATSSDGPSNGPSDGGGPPGGYQGGYYPPVQTGPYGNSPYPPSGPPPMHHPTYGGGPPSSIMYSPSRMNAGSSGNANSGSGTPSQRPRSSPDLMNAYCHPTETENPDIDIMFSSSMGVGPPHDDDGTGSISGGGGSSSKDKGRGSYKCGRVKLVLCCVVLPRADI
jgi:hypothetical protein